MSNEQQTAGKTQVSGADGRASAAPARGGAGSVARRDAMISQLKRTIAEECENSEKLRKAVEDLRFQMQILEQSYAKQLADARQQGASGDDEPRIAELEAANQEMRQLLSESQDEIHRLKREREQSQHEPGARGAWQVGPPAAEQEWYEEGTINALMDDAKWTAPERPAGAPPSAPTHGPRHDDTVIEDMISADWAYSAGNDRD